MRANRPPGAVQSLQIKKGQGGPMNKNTDLSGVLETHPNMFNNKAETPGFVRD